MRFTALLIIRTLSNLSLYNSTFCQESFCVAAAPRLWNDLSKDLRNTGLSIGIDKHLKTRPCSASWGCRAFV